MSKATQVHALAAVVMAIGGPIVAADLFTGYYLAAAFIGAISVGALIFAGRVLVVAREVDATTDHRP